MGGALHAPGRPALAVGAAEDALGLAQAELDANLGHGPVDPVLGDLDGVLVGAVVLRVALLPGEVRELLAGEVEGGDVLAEVTLRVAGAGAREGDDVGVVAREGGGQDEGHRRLLCRGPSPIGVILTLGAVSYTPQGAGAGAPTLGHPTGRWRGRPSPHRRARPSGWSRAGSSPPRTPRRGRR